MTIAQRLQTILDREGWTQEEAAERLGVSRQTVNQLLNGRRRVTATMALRLAKLPPRYGQSKLMLSAKRWLDWQANEDLQIARSSWFDVKRTKAR